MPETERPTCTVEHPFEVKLELTCWLPPPVYGNHVMCTLDHSVTHHVSLLARNAHDAATPGQVRLALLKSGTGKVLQRQLSTLAQCGGVVVHSRMRTTFS